MISVSPIDRVCSIALAVPNPSFSCAAARNMALDDVFADRAFVAQLGRLLRAQAMRRFPALRGEADDLVSHTLQDLWSYASKNPGLTNDVARGNDGAFSGEGWNAIVRVAVTILGRRAVDRIRYSAARWAEDSLSARSEDHQGDGEAVPSGAPSLPRHLLLQQMLQVCIAELAHANAQERDALLSAVANDGHRSTALSDVDRQRVSRLRRRLADAIQRKLGESARVLLAAELRDE